MTASASGCFLDVSCRGLRLIRADVLPRALARWTFFAVASGRHSPLGGQGASFWHLKKVAPNGTKAVWGGQDATKATQSQNRALSGAPKRRINLLMAPGRADFFFGTYYQPSRPAPLAPSVPSSPVLHRSPHGLVPAMPVFKFSDFRISGFFDLRNVGFGSMSTV